MKDFKKVGLCCNQTTVVGEGDMIGNDLVADCGANDTTRITKQGSDPAVVVGGGGE